MRAEERKASSELERKQKIRNRYQTARRGNVRVIPAKAERDFYDPDTPCRVGVYARVSTDNVEQTSSYELQKKYYEEKIRRFPNWSLVEIYADEGISGTSLNHRDAFVRMIKDCEKGKIDLIMTKSVSRFSRNVVDCIKIVRELKQRKSPIAVWFETENIFSLKDDADMQLSFISTMAQEESHSKSKSMNHSIEMRFELGLYLTPVLLGYDHDEDGNLIVNPEEALTVRLIFFMFLCGYKFSEISAVLEKYCRVTKLGNTTWSSSSIRGILENERYCGDILAHKTFTPNYLDHKKAKVIDERPQYYETDHHDAIISHEDFIAAQNMLAQVKYGFKSAMPELKVIDGGILKGFVQINPKWVGFLEGDYLSACHSVLSEQDYLNPVITLKKKKGDFKLESYEVTRSQYVPTSRKISCAMSSEHIRFSSDAIHALSGVMYVELLYHPIYQLLVVRESDKSNRHAVKWCEYNGEKYRPRKINGCAFMPIFYKLCEWREDRRYTLTGYVKEQDGKRALMFYVDEPEIRFIKDGMFYTAYPKKWGKTIGDPYLMHEAKSVSIFAPEVCWELERTGVVANVPPFVIPNEKQLLQQIKEITDKFEKQVKEWDAYGNG